MTDDVINLRLAKAVKEDSNKGLSVVDTLEDALKFAKEREAEGRPFAKAVSLLLDTSNDNYSVSWFAANITTSEKIALVEVAKSEFLADMGY